MFIACGGGGGPSSQHDYENAAQHPFGVVRAALSLGFWTSGRALASPYRVYRRWRGRGRGPWSLRLHVVFYCLARALLLGDTKAIPGTWYAVDSMTQPDANSQQTDRGFRAPHFG